MQAQYYWSGHDPSGPDSGGNPDLNRRGAGSDDEKRLYYVSAT